MEVKADYQQIVGQVKERNKLYRAIIEISELTKKYKKTNETSPPVHELLKNINHICDTATEGII